MKKINKEIILPPVGIKEQLNDALGMVSDSRFREIKDAVKRKENLFQSYLLLGEEIYINGQRVHDIRYDKDEKIIYYTFGSPGKRYYFPLQYAKIIIKPLSKVDDFSF